ncbi:MAG: cardiolipin synthase [Clostridia bacterium]|nr:cardiolipin synthase [Clostridia bacterium]
MKKTYRYKVNDKQIEREYNYIPVRYILAALITLIEIAAIIGIVVALCYFVPYFYLAAFATQVFCVVRIIASDDNPDYKVPWLLFVMILPIAGFILYFLFYSRKLQKKFVKRLNELKNNAYQKEDEKLFVQLKEENIVAYNQAKALCAVSEAHLFSDTKQTYFASGEEMFASMLTDLRAAKKFIFMEYFIIEEGKFWDSILEILKEKAAAGLDVRVVYDDVGCMSTLPGDYDRQLRKFGIDATPFSRLKGQADGEFNNRSHRKITVIDGFIAYTGGVNIADEYINHVVRFGHWKDVGLRLEGNAAWEMTKLFLIDYGLNSKPKKRKKKKTAQEESKTEYYPVCSTRATGYVIPFGDGPRPIYERRVSKIAIQNMLDQATRYVYMFTPYLILDNETCGAIEGAALRGVDVRIVVPHIPDKKLVFGMTRSFYSRLMDAGVKIYEYTPGFIHAKVYLADDELAIVGTVNLDYRSLVHHFENGVWMYGCECIRDIKQDVQETLAKSELVEKKNLKISMWQRMVRSVVKIFAPML